jgi:hypothetical protein
MRSYLATAVGFLMFSGAAAGAENPQEAAKTACAVAAFTEYNKANVALLLSSGPLMSAQALIAQRRLVEQYCVRFAQCTVGDPATDKSRELPFRAAFSRCIREEEEEKNK